MPFTPIHFGFGALGKAVAPRHFSFQAFVVSQVLIDIEPGFGLLTGAAVLHGTTHTLPGALAIAGATLGSFALWQRFASKRYFSLGHGISHLRVGASALIGTMSHIALDSMMHADMPLSRTLGVTLHNLAGAGPEMLCQGAAALAGTVAVFRHGYRTLRRHPPIR